MSFADWFIKMCNDRGMSPTAVADAIGVSAASASYWVTGRNVPKKTTLAKVEEYFGEKFAPDDTLQTLKDAAERDALLKFADSPVLYDGKPNTSGDWVLCILYCGLRPGETAALKWSEVDLDAGTMHIRAAKEAASKREKAPKTDAGIRDIPIPKVYADRLKMRKRTGEYVFPQSDGKTAMTDSSMKRRWETIKKHIDIEMGATVERVKLDGSRKRTTIITEHTTADDLDLYDLRHTYCTDLEKKGVPINIAKYLMGHSDISVTANIYTHADNETIEAARTLIDG